MAKEGDEPSDLERGSRPGSVVIVVVAPPANFGARPRSSAAAGGEDDDDDRKMPNYVWVPLQLLLTAVACCPLLALVMTRTDWVEKVVFSAVLLPTVVGVFFFLRAVCKRPRMAVVTSMIKR
ncbi:hypothetical protein CFC21_057017 [Triticum aestivum]|uniref:Uncharacterized protein n=2 Tax=Triticum aestivum TaxID=4565 RepID=A0A3B6INK1_WHEAT|nr:uncharacterized protein LOC119293449 [Triticum dicoccoides]XP_044372514.1 uncharacterized protein LOC123094606 [Triticum aestivum]KAF7048222.1 hypothetical protein CFC21_057017 [Triticum aestivum]